MTPAPGPRDRIEGWHLLGAALLAPVLAWLLYVGVAILMADGRVFGPSQGLVAVVFMVLGLGILFMLWGVLPALAFGALGLWLLHRAPHAGSQGWIGHAVAGGLAAGTYVIAGLALAQLARPLAMLIAPWAPLAVDGELPNLRLVIACIVLAGAVAGPIYRHLSQRG